MGETIDRSPDGSLRDFFVDALGGALELGLATPDDVLKHVTPEVLAEHLPRPLWAKLLAACLAAPRVDARLIVETIGVRDLCANVPATTLWSIVTDVAQRALGRGLVAAPPPAVVGAEEPRRGKPPEKAAEKASEKAADKAADKPAEKAPDKAADKPADKPIDKPIDKPLAAEKSEPVAAPKSGPQFARASSPLAAPLPRPSVSTSGSGPIVSPAAGTPPAGTQSRAPTVTSTQTTAAPPSSAVDIYFDDDDEPAPLEAPPVSHRAQTVPGGAVTSPRAGNGTRPPTGAGASSRRPQASARSDKRTTPPSSRRAAAPSSDFDFDTDVGGTSSRSASVDVEVDDDQLVDWSASEETVTSGHDVDTRKR